MMDKLRADRAARRAQSLDNFRLAEEVKRHASVAARHLSRAELAYAEGDQRDGDMWLFAAENQELFFLAEVDEARERLAANDQELPSYLALFGAMPLVRKED